jgi:NADPH:quinone reductase-like Zn-dependent oxidoreductase
MEMKKIAVHRAGSFGRLKMESFPDPSAGEGQVVVETKAVGVNYADCVVRMGLYASAKKYIGWPITPGFEFSGIVREVGKGVEGFTPGSKVFGVTRFGGYSTHVVVPSDQIFEIPENLSFEETAAFPAVYLTAYYALHLVVKIYPGSTLLVHSAAGGVGSAILQLSKQANWRTIAVVGSSHKVKPAQELGADEVIDKSQQNLWKTVEKLAPEGCDIILDGNGFITLRQGFKHLKPTGKLISYGFHSMFPRKAGFPNYLMLAINYLRTPFFNPIDMHNQNRSVVTFNLSFLFERKDLFQIGMRSLLSWLKEGKIRMPKITTYAFEDVAQAHRDLQSGNTVGKLVLIP